ncbi:MAG: threonylcarbamoyl-AMP synthase [Ignavibacteriales bacterium]
MIEKVKTKAINIDVNPAEGIEQAVRVFYEGGIFIYPTDTIYGIGGNPFNADTMERITQLKRRDEKKHYIMLMGNIETLLRYVDLKTELHMDFLNSLWPNPVSVVLRLNKNTRNLWGQEDAAFRIPNHNFCRKLLNTLNTPLISTSVNRSGEPPLNDYSQIIGGFSENTDLFLYSTGIQLNQGSTLIRLTGTHPELMREGKVPFSDILSKFELAGYQI